MKKIEKGLIPVLLGGDLNAYSMATSLKRGCGLSSVVLARERLAICDGPEYIDLTAVKGLDSPDVAAPYLCRFAQKHRTSRLMLIPCADWYMEMLQYARDALSGHFYFHVPSFEVWRGVSDKVSFTEIMKRYSIPHPHGVAIGSEGEVYEACTAVRPPYVLKAADSTAYFKNRFTGQRKVYFAKTPGECRQIARTVFASGYGGKLLIQEEIRGKGGKAPRASVLTTYSDKSGRVRAAVRGRVLLEEKGDTSRGNYSAIVTSPLFGIDAALINMLDGIGYTGIANFDILEGEGGEYCLELNPRQGRSFDYTRAAGINLAKMLVDEMEGRDIGSHFVYPTGYWHEAGHRTVICSATDKELLSEAERLFEQRRAFSPYDYKTGEGIAHRIYLALRELKRSCKKRGGRGYAAF